MKKVLIFALLSALGCKTKSIVADQSLGVDFNLQINKQTRIDNFKLSFDDVADSRCPSNVQCIRAGEVVVDLNLDAQQKIKMCLGDCQVVQPDRKKGFVTQDSLEIVINSQKYLLILKQVNPYPITPAITKENYEVKMQIIRR